MNEKNEGNIINPCIAVCKTDTITGFCYGCGRSNEDKDNWKNSQTDNNWKEKNLVTIRKRLTGWQKQAFIKSYQHKKDKGRSLIKQKLLNSLK
jgi:predicted Fe-S protein YdhL (DUF1289 family)